MPPSVPWPVMIAFSVGAVALAAARVAEGQLLLGAWWAFLAVCLGAVAWGYRSGRLPRRRR